MANPPKKKGTGGETELLRLFAGDGIVLHRTAAGTAWDLEGVGEGLPVEILATRPDRGEWLLTLRYRDAARLLKGSPFALRVESKRYARFSLHRIFEGKFGRAQ